MDSGVSTHTVTDSGVSSAPTSQKLVLRVKEKKTKITWTDETVDNEHMNKKSSKRCCIYHKVKKFAESDSDESDSDTEKAAKALPPPGRPKPFQRHHA